MRDAALRLAGEVRGRLLAELAREHGRLLEVGARGRIGAERKPEGEPATVGWIPDSCSATQVATASAIASGRLCTPAARETSSVAKKTIANARASKDTSSEYAVAITSSAIRSSKTARVRMNVRRRG